MKKYLIRLPRKFRVWWGRQFLYMLGDLKRNEFNKDITLYTVLYAWLEGNVCRK